MFDAFFVVFSRQWRDRLKPEYRPDGVVTGRTLTQPNAKRLAVIFPFWHARPYQTRMLSRQLAKQGWAVLCYDFDAQLLVPDSNMVISSFEHLQKTIVNDLNRTLADGNYTTVRLIGISLGAVALSVVAERFEGFTEAELVVAGDDLATCMWSGIRTRGVRREFENGHMTLQRLRTEWHSLAPSVHAKSFKGKPVHLILSRHDAVIPTANQDAFKRDLIRAGAAVRVSTNRIGHYLSVLRYCRSAR